MAEYSSSSSSAAEEVAANSDLLIEILSFLPIRSLWIFKSVSKQWLSTITTHFFDLHRNLDSTIVSGLFLHPYWPYSANLFPELNFIPLINTINTPIHDPYSQFKDLSFFPGLPAHIRIINSCHGLLLCCYGHHHDNNPKPNYLILNPTTKKFKILPKCHNYDLICLTLAFDPLKSPHYKVVCLRYIDFVPTFQAGPYHRIMVYSSETGSWKASGVPVFAAKYKKQYDTGVYWNGAVNWFNSSGIGDSVYYNMDEERLGIIPLPPIPEGNDWNNREFRHYGETRGHLHVVEMYDRMHRVDVYELERDYSGWYLKFCFDLDAVGIPRDTRFCPVSMVRVVRMESDDESFLVLHVPGKLLRYIFGDGTLKKICDVAIPSRFHSGGSIESRLRYHSGGSIESRLRYSWFSSFQYIESLFGV